MNARRTVFSQIMDYFPSHQFRKCIKRYQGNYKMQKFSCYDQFLCMAFAQLTFRESLRDIEACLRSRKEKLYHLGIRANISKSTLAYANETRDWRIYADMAQVLISRARELYAKDPFILDLEETVYALDATTIKLCLSLFPWAHFRSKNKAIKLHTLMDLKGSIPTFIRITPAKIQEVSMLDHLIPEPGSFYILDRGYLDFSRLYKLQQASSFFVIRGKAKVKYRRLYSYPVDKSTGLRSDQTVVFALPKAAQDYPDKIRRIRFFDKEHERYFTFLTNNFSLPALTIAQLYKSRWQIELFFKWIKQHLRIKAFFGTSENAVKTQIWIAISVYVLIAIIKKRLKVSLSLYNILQIFSVSVFELVPISQLLTESEYASKSTDFSNQLSLL
jgi:hypothetical protein